MDSPRVRDYTYPKAQAIDSFATSGGADLFYSFINKELIPQIDSGYRTDTTSRAIMGIHLVAISPCIHSYVIAIQMEMSVMDSIIIYPQVRQ